MKCPNSRIPINVASISGFCCWIKFLWKYEQPILMSPTHQFLDDWTFVKSKQGKKHGHWVMHGLVYGKAHKLWPQGAESLQLLFLSIRKIQRPRNESSSLYQVTYFPILTITSEVLVVKGKVGKFSVQVTTGDAAAKPYPLWPLLRSIVKFKT